MMRTFCFSEDADVSIGDAHEDGCYIPAVKSVSASLAVCKNSSRSRS
jgi:hypothetical protein